MTAIKNKIYQRQKLIKIVASLKEKGYKIGLTNGVFDLVHAGHVSYLEEAKRICDILIVSLNTDASVREYKGSNRPVNSQMDRARVIAAFASVDFVTFHPERHMEETLIAFKPDFYIKGSDYSNKTLTSAYKLEQWSGQTAFVPLVGDLSSTKMINVILRRFGDRTTSIQTPVLNEQKAVIFDRDGVINKDIEYLHSADKFELLPNVIQGIKSMQKMGYKIVVITNQPGIGMGYYTEEDFYRVNKKMLATFHENDIFISKIYFCPHNLADNCVCRKPNTALFQLARNDLHLNMERSWTIGDKLSDITAGLNMKSKAILIKPDNQETVEKTGYFIAKDLVEAVNIIKMNS